MASDAGLLECPMCDFKVLPSDDYILQLHFEQVHTTDSPFRIEDDVEPPPPSLPPRPTSKRKSVGDTPSSDEEENTVTCPDPDCGELVLLTDFNDHLDYHAAETLSFDETTGKYHSHHSSATMQGLGNEHPHGFSKNQFPGDSSMANLPEAVKRYNGHNQSQKLRKHRHRSSTNSSEKSTLSRSILTFNPFAKIEKMVKPPSKSARLGKSELGPYAWEDRMPQWLHDQLAAGPKVTIVNRIGRDGRLIKQEQVQNETPGIIPILAQLSALDRSVKEAYYCHPSTLHIGKTPREGGFCGYRNIQMLLSYIQGAKAQGHEEFPGRTPGILNLQDLIETAWDKGINEIGRVQTGGIRDTRKYIGTPEAQAFFLSSEINCAVEMFSDMKDRKIEAHEILLDAIERYFAQAAVKDGSNVYKTLLPPIYLQQPGHSITIIGFERRRDGARNLVVFDPMYSTSPAMHKLLGRKNIRTARPEVFHAYRRGSPQLRKHAMFEILMLTATPPLFPAWDALRHFPDCRFVYAFFRARTLGYDVYPEDYFLPNFPWQHYGGLWVCDEARFARSQSLNLLSAQALRRITSEGASSRSSSSSNSATSPFNSSGFHHLPAMEAHRRDEGYVQLPSYVPLLDGSASSYLTTAQRNGSSPVLSTSNFYATLPQPQAIPPKLSLLTDVGRKYPGFPTPLSPTLSAKQLFPSPLSETCLATTTDPPRPAIRNISPMSINGSKMCDLSPRYASPSHKQYTVSIGLIDGIIAQSTPQTPPYSPSLPSESPTCALSLRTAMLRSIYSNDNSVSSSPSSSIYSPQSIPISNGTETNLSSPLSPTGTVLVYTSRRPVASGLLGVSPLSEAQVAEYRFWRPCGGRVCAFGCGAGREGEIGAAKRLFKSVEEVSGCGYAGDDEGGGKEEGEEEEEDEGKGEGYAEQAKAESVWAGRRLVTDWANFLSGLEREGVARF